MTTTSGHATVGDLSLYHETHGGPSAAGLPPVLLLHGGLFDIGLQFGDVVPGLAADRQVVALDFQGHGGTHDLDRPFTAAAWARDAVGVLDHLGIDRVDVVGYSMGGTTALELAVRHADRVRRVVASSTTFRPDGARAAGGADGAEPADETAGGGMTVEMIAGTPMEATYLAKSPHPDHEHLQSLLDKLGAAGADFGAFTDDEVRGIAAPVLLTVGDCDLVRLDHAVEFLRLRGGDVFGDFEGVPDSQLAVLPGTNHFGGYANAPLVLEILRPFLSVTQDAPV